MNLDPETYLGFYVRLTIQTACGITYVVLICTLIALQIGIFTYVNAFALDLKKQFEHLSKLETFKRNPRSNYHRIEVKQKLVLTEAIELHIDMLK